MGPALDIANQKSLLNKETLSWGKMGGKIPRELKTKVIHQWLQGIRREAIAKNFDLGTGTISNIIKDASLEEEYHDMVLFRQLALELNEYGIKPLILGYALRYSRMSEDNGIEINYLEPLVADFASYCFKHQISVVTLIQSGYNALLLEKELGVPVKMLTAHITRLKKTRKELLDQCQNQFKKLREMQDEYEITRKEYEIRKDKTKEYKEKHPLIEANIELENELAEMHERWKQDKETISRLESDLAEQDREVALLEGANLSKEEQLIDAKNQLSVQQKRIDKLNRERGMNKQSGL